MRREGDVAEARRDFFNHPSPNLELLVRNRYEWMNEFIDDTQVGLDIGCGMGLSKQYLHAKAVHLSDLAEHDWLDFRQVDALSLPFEDGSYDFIVCGNMIHHVAQPLRLFAEVERVLKPGGKLLIQEVNASLCMRLILRIMRHEGYSFEPNVFDKNQICNDPNDPWSANCAIPNLLFDDLDRFHAEVRGFQCVHKSFSECLCMLNSGGVIAKTFYVPLPKWVVRTLAAIDSVLTTLAPQVFAMQRQIVLEKRLAPAPSNLAKAA